MGQYRTLVLVIIFKIKIFEDNFFLFTVYYTELVTSTSTVLKILLQHSNGTGTSTGTVLRKNYFKKKLELFWYRYRTNVPISRTYISITLKYAKIWVSLLPYNLRQFVLT